MNNKQHYLDFVRLYYVMADTSHDFRYIQRIFNWLDGLSQGVTPAPSRHKLFFLAAFHGLAGYVQDNTAFRSSVKAFLTRLGWAAADIEEAFASLREYPRAPRGVEERIVRDAVVAEEGALDVPAMA